ncbi:hypothetical protein CRUP_027541, partial [Coryphaenoides rupestris]
MGTQEGEKDWVDVANDLLRKCRINLRLTKLADCDGNVFIAFYENILGEKVPDFIAEPKSQEDDVHNVQSVIDSLALDYLQISLSHITGENIVRGDKESITNLLEIFDGLLEYLNEEINEEIQNEGFNEDLREVFGPVVGRDELQSPEQEVVAMLERASLSSSECCWKAEETGSTNERIHLGDSARTFTAKQDVGAVLQPLPWAVLLQPPYQATTAPQKHNTADPLPPALGVQPQPAAAESSSTPSARSESSQKRISTLEEVETLEPASGGASRVLFHVQPDVVFLTLPEEAHPAAICPPDTEERAEEEGSSFLGWEKTAASVVSLEEGEEGNEKEDEEEEGALSSRRRKNKAAEKELHHMSEKLSRRLEDLDQQQLVNEAYEEELRRYEAREEARLAQERLRAQQAEREYREAILRDLPRTRHSSPGQRERKKPVAAQPRSAPLRHSAARRRQDHPRKAPPMKVKENDLLPVLLQEFPLLQLSPHGLARMWQQQMGQVDRLHGLAASSAHHHQRRKLGSQVEDAQRRQELLAEIIRKEREHNKRLRDFKERIQQQKSAQSRLREQRQQVARANKYHSSYHTQLRARLTRARSREEKFSLLAETLAQERQEIQVRKKAQEKALMKMKRELRSRMEREIGQLQSTLAQERQEIQVRKKAQEKALMKMKRELRSRMEREIGQLQSVIIQNDQD